MRKRLESGLILGLVATLVLSVIVGANDHLKNKAKIGKLVRMNQGIEDFYAQKEGGNGSFALIGVTWQTKTGNELEKAMASMLKDFGAEECAKGAKGDIVIHDTGNGRKLQVQYLGHTYVIHGSAHANNDFSNEAMRFIRDRQICALKIALSRDEKE
jgi:hypothetical protein